MGKKDRKAAAEVPEPTDAQSSGSTAALDPVLSALFSAKDPVKVPAKPTIKAHSIQKQPSTASDLPTPEATSSDTNEPSEIESSESSESEREIDEDRPKKRRRVQNDELEDVYFRKLADAEERDLEQRQGQQTDPDEGEVSDSPSNDLEDLSDEEDGLTGGLPVHEALAGTEDNDLADKTSRTIFLSNVSTAAIKEKASKKALLTHLESAFPKDSDAKIESIRFRSTPYETGKGPKRAAYATKALMDETAASTHAYVVLSSESAAKILAAKLNGTIVLDRHLHVDRLGAPFQTDHRRCIFVGNLPFVDQETLETNDEENPHKRPKARLRADPEEGLWRTFGKIGTVENVRMVRDKATRIGKGFAYVQFTDENAVEAALLMNDKKFPPLLPRKLRIMRATKPSTKPKKQLQGARGAKQGDDKKGRGKRVQNARDRERGKSRATTGGTGGGREREQKKAGVVFEGHRASREAGKYNVAGKGKGKGKGKKKRPENRSAKRGAAFRSGGGKKKRDM